MKTVIQSLRVRLRAFVIWQKLGFLPWRKRRETQSKKGGRGDFYKGAFDAIPFLNDDAKRTFSHLLLRPGYMMRDYIRGDHERYLAPLTALIIFYAFFALVSAVMQPVQHESRAKSVIGDLEKVDVDMDIMGTTVSTTDSLETRRKVASVANNTLELIRTGYIYLHLDQFPEEVDTQHESSIAALENTLRSQGIPLFLGQFFLLWLAIAIALRRFKLGMSAYAAVAAYVLCQFSFFMLFAVLLTWGKSTSLGVMLMLVLLVIDLRQLLGISIKKSLKRSIAVGIHYGILYCLFFVLVSMVAVTIAYFKA